MTNPGSRRLNNCGLGDIYCVSDGLIILYKSNIRVLEEWGTGGEGTT